MNSEKNCVVLLVSSALKVLELFGMNSEKVCITFVFILQILFCVYLLLSKWK